MFAAHHSHETAQAELTKDMLEAMLESFDSLATPEGTVTVEFRDNALWVASASGILEFVGIATLSPAFHHLR